jgi:hypothetical protein
MLDSWIDTSRRGLFGFDWDWGLGWPEPNKPYRIITSPAEPLSIGEIPREIREYLSQATFPELIFTETREIMIERVFPLNNLSILR